MFEPATLSVTVEKDDHIPRELVFNANRVLFSIWGAVVGLNKEPEKMVTVQAKSITSNGSNTFAEVENNLFVFLIFCIIIFLKG